MNLNVPLVSCPRLKVLRRRWREQEKWMLVKSHLPGSGECERAVGGPASVGGGRCLLARPHRGLRNPGGTRYRAGRQRFHSKCSTMNC